MTKTQQFRMLAIGGLLLLGSLAALRAETPHLLQRPALSQSQIVFAYAGDLWTVDRTGGKAQRLTTGVGIETDPVFSPDGSKIAFTGEYDGNTDVFVVPASGGVPRRLTYHPAADAAVGWTPDGKAVIFRSSRESTSARFTKLFKVSVEGGLPEALPLPMGTSGQFSSDGKYFAYTPVSGGSPFGYASYVSWGNYRGGLASYIWIVQMSDLSVVKVPRDKSNDYNPMWVGERLYFLSDRNGATTLYRYEPGSKTAVECLKGLATEIRSASAGPGGIVYDQFGELSVYDLSTGKSKPVAVEITGDMPEVRPRLADVNREIRAAGISPTGVRAVFEAHGDILTAPAQHGDIRDITNTPGVMERSPAWSPDGQSIAYFSDESGKYALHIRAQNGEGTPRKFALSDDASYYFSPTWSPDSKSIAFIDNKLNKWILDTANGKLTAVDKETQYELNGELAWSPDSKWLAYSKSLANRLHGVFLYSMASGKSVELSDGTSDARMPEFDRDGQWLYFTASTNYGPTTSGLDMSSDEHEVTRSVYAAVLAADGASPVAPESDEEKGPEAAKAEGNKPEGAKGPKAPPKPVKVDLAGIEDRIVALPIPAAGYVDLTAGKTGTLYLLQGPGRRPGGASTLQKFDLKTRKVEKLAENVREFSLSADGEKMLLEFGQPVDQQGPQMAGPPEPSFAIVPANAPVKPGEGMLKLTGMQVRVDPAAEWKQMYHEVWQVERSYFYDPSFHGVDTFSAEEKYSPYLKSIASRADLNYLFQEMLMPFSVGHLRGSGGTIPGAAKVQGGLLGADYQIVDGRYRIKRIYTGEHWNPQAHAPLDEPGLKVKEGDFILSVNGEDLNGRQDISQLLEGTAGKSVMLRVASDAGGANSHEVTVRPVADDIPLRNLAWMEANRRKVERLSGGKLAYVYLPDTGIGGLTNFNRYYFAQLDKHGAVIDERFNSGGQAADYMIEVMKRPVMSYWAPRYGAIYKTPAGSIEGPKVMLTNEFSGSGGDALPWYFREAQLGPLVGKRTWGGLVGISGYPLLMDGGQVTSPSFGFFSPNGEWEVENHGVTPDVEVEQEPKPVSEGHDPQLEKAVSLALSALEKHPVPEPRKPEYPDYHKTTRTKGSTATGGSLQ